MAILKNYIEKPVVKERISISVVTVCYNAIKTIEGTMLSVLNQTYDNVEYIIIDGGSTDGTVDIIKKYADRLAYWVSESDNGIYDAMNKGIAVATGAYINFMNAGDGFTNSDVLEDVVSCLNPEATIVYGNWNIVTEGFYSPRTPLNNSYIRRQMPFCHQAGFYKTAYHKEHLFPDKYKLIGDYKIIYDAYNDGDVKFQYIPVCIADYDITLGRSASIDMYKKSMYEKYDLWGIKNNVFKKMPHEISLLLTALSYKFKKRLSVEYILKIKQLKNSLRSHQQ